MQELIAKAKALGEQIRQHERYAKLRVAEKKLRDNPDIQKLLADYEESFQTITEKEKKQQPVEPDEKRALADLQNRISNETLLQDLARTQADYAELMNKINESIRQGLQPEDEDQDAAAENASD